MRCKKDILAENKFKVEKLVKDVFELKNDSDSIRFNELSKIASTFSKDENYDFFIFFQREKLKANLKNSINVDYSTKMLKILPELETIYTDLNEESKTRFGEILYHLEEYQLFELLSTSKLTEKINSIHRNIGLEEIRFLPEKSLCGYVWPFPIARGTWPIPIRKNEYVNLNDCFGWSNTYSNSSVFEIPCDWDYQFNAFTSCTIDFSENYFWCTSNPQMTIYLTQKLMQYNGFVSGTKNLNGYARIFLGASFHSTYFGAYTQDEYVASLKMYRRCGKSFNAID